MTSQPTHKGEAKLGEPVTFTGTLSTAGLQGLIDAIFEHHASVVAPLEGKAAGKLTLPSPKPLQPQPQQKTETKPDAK